MNIRKILVITSTLIALSGCQALQEVEARKAARQSDITNAKLLNTALVQNIIDTHAPIKLEADFTLGVHGYKTQVYNSIAHQQSQLLGNPVFIRQDITLTKEMYNGDIKAFLIPLSSLKLAKVGNHQNYDAAIVMNTNLIGEQFAPDMTTAEFNEAILKTIAVSELSSADNTDQENYKIKERARFYTIDNGYSRKYRLTSPTFEFFTMDKKKNLEIIEHLMGSRTYRDYRGYSHYLPTKSDKAKEMIGETIEAVTMVGSAFSVNKTGQKVVIGLPHESLLRDKQGNVLDGSIEPNFFYHEWMEKVFNKDEVVDTATFVKK